MQSDKVLRHPLAVRINHWVIAISGFMLIFSGFGEMPMYKRYNVVKIPGLAWSEDFITMLYLHYIFGFIFTVAVFFHAVYHFRRREFAILPKKGDLKESIHIMKAILTGKPEPAHEKFLAEQRLAYAGFAVTIIGLIVTGLIKTYKNLGVILDPTFLMIVTNIHTMLTMVFIGLIFAHLGAFIIKANRHLLPSMFTGYVSREYAQKRHSKWEFDAEGFKA